MNLVAADVSPLILKEIRADSRRLLRIAGGSGAKCAHKVRGTLSRDPTSVSLRLLLFPHSTSPLPEVLDRQSSKQVYSSSLPPFKAAIRQSNHRCSCARSSPFS